MKRLPRLRETVRAREPHRAAPVPFVRVFVPKPLHDREVRLVPRQRLQALRQRVILPRLLDVRKPSLRRDAPTKAEKHQPLRWCRWSRCGGKATKAQRLQSGQSDERSAGLEEVTAGFHGEGECGDSETSFVGLFAAKFFAGGQLEATKNSLHRKALRLRLRFTMSSARAASVKPYGLPRAYSMRASVKPRAKSSLLAAMRSRSWK